MSINLVIVAGGKQTRFKDLSVFPKVLLPTKNNSSILKEFLDKCQDLSKIYLVINSKYEKMTSRYIEVNKLSSKIELISTDCSNGSFLTLDSVKDKLPNENLLFVWSDLILSSMDPLLNACKSISSDGIVFTNSKGQYRYLVKSYSKAGLEKHLKSIELSEVYLGNAPGIYFLRSKALFEKYQMNANNIDLIDVIKEYSDNFDFNVLDIVEDLGVTLVEYKSLDVYVDLLKDTQKVNSMQTRFFNVLKVNDSERTIEKLVVDDKYKSLIEKEILWYKKIKSLDNNQTITPKILDFYDNGFKMEFLDKYKPLHDILDSLEEKCEIKKINQVYSNLFKAIEKCSLMQTTEISFEQFEEDFKKELFDKVISRCDAIKEMLIDYNKNELIEVLNKNNKILFDFAYSSSDVNKKSKTIKYYFTHGDLNGSNVMVHPETLEVKFLDPRGYFGNTVLSGWLPYEYAKVLYCLFGYDDFNLKPQIYKLNFPKPRLSLEYSKCKEFFDRIGGYDNYLRLVGVIYISLAGYISQDIMKANIAYNYGMKILKELV